jgi:nitrate reductase NapAB chaperone NapD
VTVSGVVVACRPEDLSGVIDSLDALPWAEVHHTDAAGKLVVSIEARDAGESIARLREIQTLPGVVMAELGGYYVDEEGDEPERISPPPPPTERTTSRRTAKRRREEQS